jgi:hypothetical protein
MSYKCFKFGGNSGNVEWILFNINSLKLKDTDERIRMIIFDERLNFLQKS